MSGLGSRVPSIWNWKVCFKPQVSLLHGTVPAVIKDHTLIDGNNIFEKFLVFLSTMRAKFSSYRSHGPKLSIIVPVHFQIRA